MYLNYIIIKSFILGLFYEKITENCTMEHYEMILGAVGKAISLILEFISIVCIVYGFITALLLIVKKKPIIPTPIGRRIKLQFGGWLALALEFQLASDIVKTTVTPTYDNLIQLGALAIIRTFLNYFLNKELKEEAEVLHQMTETAKAEMQA